MALCVPVRNCLSKKTFATRGEAKSDDLVRKRACKAYRCNLCDRWHLTTRGKKR